MKFRFNGGRGAILCENCGVILKSGNEIPQYVWDAVKKGIVKELPGMYCEDGCERSKEFLTKCKCQIKNKNNEDI